MKPLLAMLLSAMFLIAPVPANAQIPASVYVVNSTQELLNDCQTTRRPSTTFSNEDAIRFAVCLNVIDGIVAGASAASATPLFCLPTGSTIGQRVAVFMQWTEANPSEWHQPPVVGVLLAMEEFFPCRR